jgi:hypothetical protein
MRTKLLGAFIAALAITAFAALPSAAMAQGSNVTLKEGNLTPPAGTTLRAHSTNTTFTGRKEPGVKSGIVVACARTSIRGQIRTNPGARITFRPGGVFQNATGGDQCAVTGPPVGRLEARVENVTFRKDITLQKTGTAVSGSTEVRFTFRISDRELSPEPIAACNYEGEVKVTSVVGSDSFKAKTTGTKLEVGSVGSCDPEGDLAGDFRLTRRDGTTAVTTN